MKIFFVHLEVRFGYQKRNEWGTRTPPGGAAVRRAGRRIRFVFDIYMISDAHDRVALCPSFSFRRGTQHKIRKD